MKISIALDGEKQDSLITENLSEATHLFIVDVENWQVLRIFDVEDGAERDLAFARQTIDENCEAIICGEIEEAPFELLARASVSRYNGTGLKPAPALKLMNANMLPLIREYRGGPGCAGEHSGGECHEHEHEHEQHEHDQHEHEVKS